MEKRKVVAPARETPGVRVRQLVEEVHGGNVVKAAADIGIERRTLAHYMGPKSQNPRVPILERIAQFYGKRLEWLLTGKGERDLPSSFGMPATNAAAFALADVMRELELPEDVQTEYLKAAYSVGTAANVLTRPRRVGSRTETAVVGGPIDEIISLQVRAWATLLRWLVDVYGKDGAFRRLDGVAKHAHRFHTSYAPQLSEAGLDIARAAGFDVSDKGRK